VSAGEAAGGGAGEATTAVQHPATQARAPVQAAVHRGPGKAAPQGRCCTGINHLLQICFT